LAGRRAFTAICSAATTSSPSSSQWQRSASWQDYSDGNNQPWDGGSYRQGATLGTQVGSEGVKDDVPLETVSFAIKGAAFRGEVIGLEPTVKAPANAMSTGISGQEMSDAVKAPASPTPEVFTSVSN
jgi:hypothetical protein